LVLISAVPPRRCTQIICTLFTNNVHTVHKYFTHYTQIFYTLYKYVLICQFVGKRYILEQNCIKVKRSGIKFCRNNIVMLIWFDHCFNGINQIDLNFGSSISGQTIHFRAKLCEKEKIKHQILMIKHYHVYSIIDLNGLILSILGLINKLWYILEQNCIKVKRLGIKFWRK